MEINKKKKLKKFYTEREVFKYLIKNNIKRKIKNWRGHKAMEATFGSYHEHWQSKKIMYKNIKIKKIQFTF